MDTSLKDLQVRFTALLIRVTNIVATWNELLKELNNSEIQLRVDWKYDCNRNYSWLNDVDFSKHKIAHISNVVTETILIQIQELNQYKQLIVDTLNYLEHYSDKDENINESKKRCKINYGMISSYLYDTQDPRLVLKRPLNYLHEATNKHSCCFFNLKTLFCHPSHSPSDVSRRRC